MKAVTGQEMRRLMWAVSLMVILMVLAVIAYFMVDITVTYNRNIEDNKEKVVQESVRSIQDFSSIMVLSSGLSPELMQVFNQDLAKEVLSGDLDAFFKVAKPVAISFFPIDYVGFIAEGELVDHAARKGFSVDPAELSTEPPEGGYQVLERLGGTEGFFISAFVPVDLGIVGVGIGKSMYANIVVDRSERMADIEAYFRDQRNSLLMRLIIAAVIAVIASLLITTFGLRHFTRKYVVDPIEKINRQAQEIMAGTFQGEVEVEESSAYAALQGLLRSGQKVLQRMDEELRS